MRSADRITGHKRRASVQGSCEQLGPVEFRNRFPVAAILFGKGTLPLVPPFMAPTAKRDKVGHCPGFQGPPVVDVMDLQVRTMPATLALMSIDDTPRCAKAGPVLAFEVSLVSSFEFGCHD
jgi:hypothetical protein